MFRFIKHTVIVSSINLIAYALAYAGATTLGIEVTPVGAVLTISVLWAALVNMFADVEIEVCK